MKTFRNILYLSVELRSSLLSIPISLVLVFDALMGIVASALIIYYYLDPFLGLCEGVGMFLWSITCLGIIYGTIFMVGSRFDP